MLIAALLLTAPVIAQDTPAPQPAAAAAAATTTVDHAPAATATVEHKDATGTVEHLKPDATTEEVLSAAFKTVEEAQKYFNERKSSTKKAFVWAGVLAAVLNLLIMFISRTSPFWKKRKGKTLIRVITITLGLAAGILANVAVGMPWWDAATVFLGGPGAILLKEYQKVFKTEE
jgi:hypothetical protein